MTLGKYKIFAFILCLACLTEVRAASFGDPQGSQISDNATVCLSVGARATLTGLDNLTLVPVSTDGMAGSVYSAIDTFHLESNSPVRVLVDTQQLSNGRDTIDTYYYIDGQMSGYDTATEGVHSQDHTLEVKAQLGMISSQKSGSYSSLVTLTVVPQVGGEAGCGQFSNTFRSISGTATLAYEDLIPNVGDGDYNDIVIGYTVIENYNAKQELETVTLTFEPEAKGAAYNHSLYLSLDGELDHSPNIEQTTTPAIVGDASIKISYENQQGNVRDAYSYDVSDDITIFNNSSRMSDNFTNVLDGQEYTEIPFQTTIEITLANPELNLFSDRGDDSLLLYRPVLSVHNTNMDIDLGVINSEDEMLNSDGQPFGLFIEDLWEWPLENVNISDAYPEFSDYSLESQESVPANDDWYLYPSSGDLVYTKDNAL